MCVSGRESRACYVRVSAGGFLGPIVYKWLRVSSALEFEYKSQQERASVDASEPVRIPSLWCSRYEIVVSEFVELDLRDEFASSTRISD